MTQALADRSRGYLPDVLAVDPDRGWLLMRDLDAPLLGDQPESTWELGLDALAGLQQEWLGHTGDLLAAGAELRPLRQLADWVNATALMGVDRPARAIDAISQGDHQSATVTSGYPNAQVRAHDRDIRSAFEAGHLAGCRVSILGGVVFPSTDDTSQVSRSAR